MKVTPPLLHLHLLPQPPVHHPPDHVHVVLQLFILRVSIIRLECTVIEKGIKTFQTTIIHLLSNIPKKSQPAITLSSLSILRS